MKATGKRHTYCSRCRNRRSKEHWIKKWTGLSVEEIPYRPEACEKCGGDWGSKGPCFDHDHEDGEFRGWLCHGCNTGLGKLGDNVEGLLEGIDYLLRAKARSKLEKVANTENEGI